MDRVIHYHPETYLTQAQLGTLIPSYKPTLFDAGYIDDHHRFLAHAVNRGNGLIHLTAPGLMDHAGGTPINGWLRPEDALKLYELGYYSSGDILELGSYEGLSTCILAQAMIDAGRPGTVITVDLSYREPVAENARLCGLNSRINIVTADAAEAIKSLHPKRFEFIFVDHSHTYEHVRAACLLLSTIAAPDGFVLFHDYNDSRNGEEPDYDVYGAVVDSMPKGFRFCGIYGCTGLYQAQ